MRGSWWHKRQFTTEYEGAWLPEWPWTRKYTSLHLAVLFCNRTCLTWSSAWHMQRAKCPLNRWENGGTPPLWVWASPTCPGHLALAGSCMVENRPCLWEVRVKTPPPVGFITYNKPLLLADWSLVLLSVRWQSPLSHRGSLRSNASLDGCRSGTWFLGFKSLLLCFPGVTLGRFLRLCVT